MPKRTKKPKTIVRQHKRNFATLKAAVLRGDIALMECQLVATGEAVAVIAAVDRSEGDYQFVPLAMFFNGNPYEMLNPPNPDGGFHAQEEANAQAPGKDDSQQLLEQGQSE